MPKDKKHAGTKDQMDKHVHDVLKVLRSIDAHLAAMVYYQKPSRGFAAGVEQSIAQPFVTSSVTENKDNALENIIREEIKKALGDK